MVRRYIEADCQGSTIIKANVRDPSILEQVSSRLFNRAVRGMKINRVVRHGKQLFLELDQNYLTIHLGMTGDVIVLKGRERLPKHARVVLHLDGGRRLVYDDARKFGAIGIAGSIARFIGERKLGPDALTMSKEDFITRVRRSHRPIKSLLLDQHVVAGVGNLYADECLHQSRVHPQRATSELSQGELETIWLEMRHVLWASIKVSTDFQKLPQGFLLRSRTEGAPCPRGDGALISIKLGGRTTMFCPVCQTLE